jgi:hypothetical protein
MHIRFVYVGDYYYLLQISKQGKHTQFLIYCSTASDLYVLVQAYPFFLSKAILAR